MQYLSVSVPLWALYSTLSRLSVCTCTCIFVLFTSTIVLRVYIFLLMYAFHILIIDTLIILYIDVRWWHCTNGSSSQWSD